MGSTFLPINHGMGNMTANKNQQLAWTDYVALTLLILGFVFTA
jgi:hypothetical protein